MTEDKTETVESSDLDAAQAELDPDSKIVRIEEEEFTLPERLPYVCWQMLWRGLTDEALERAFGKEQWQRFIEVADWFDVNKLVDSLPERYGMTSLGESSASDDSSSDTGDRSRQTSSGGTKSTSRKRSSAKRR